MPYDFIFPDVGEGIHEGEIVKWFVKEKDSVKVDQPLCEVETDKAVVEMPSPKSGTILKIHFEAGKTIKVGEPLVTILMEGESKDSVKQKKPNEERYTGSVVGFLQEAEKVEPIHSRESSVQITSTGILATPAVRNLAKQKGIDLSKIKGSGPEGRITVQDLDKAQPVEKKVAIKVKPKYDLFGYIDRVPLKGVKRITADKMSESIYTAPQVTNMHEVDVTLLDDLRKKDKQKNKDVTFIAYLIKAVALTLKEHLYLNATIEEDEIILRKYQNIGFAVDTENGLMVPVIKGAQEKEVFAIAQEVRKLAEDAKSRKINPMELKGGTFTISNLCSVGVDYFTPILNFPESALMGVGKLSEKPVVRDGKIVIRKIMPFSLTYDHRIVDGAQAARFMKEFIEKVESCKF